MNMNLLKNTKIQAAISGVLCVIFVVLSIAMADNLTMLAIWISLAISALVIGLWLLFGGIHEDAGHFNYFLFDRSKDKCVSAKEISFALVNENLSAYIAKYVARPIDLWDGVPKALQSDSAFRAPVAFRMLYEMSLLKGDEILRRFEDASDLTVNFVCRVVKASGDEEMADIIFRMKRQFESEQSRVVAFFTKNRRCFEGRIFNYVKNHLDDYIMEKE